MFNSMQYKDFAELIKRQRLTGTWYTHIGLVDGKEVQLKAYKTWLQIYKVDGIDYSNCMESKVGQFNKDLALPFA